MNTQNNEFEVYKKELLNNPETNVEYIRLEPEYQASRILIAARIEKGLTQKELADLSGLKQSNISRIESMSCCPSLATLNKLAHSLGKELVISFK